MKNVFKYMIVGGLLLGTTSCQKDFVDLNPTAKFLDNVYFKTPADFKAYATGLYGQLPGWDFGTMDNNTDLSVNDKTENYEAI